MEFSEPTFIDFDCPLCATPAAYPDLFKGTLQDCPNCGQGILLPKTEGEPARKIPLPLETPRLILRRLNPRDWKDLLEYYSDPSLFAFDTRQPMDEEQVCQWLEQDATAKLTDRQQGFFLGVQAKDSGKLIGDAWIHLTDDEHHQAGVSCCINPQFQRQGFGSEALAALLVFGFRDLGLHRMIAHFDSRNAAGQALAKRIGLRREGEFLKNRKFEGHWINTVCFGMLDEEYLGKMSVA